MALIYYFGPCINQKWHTVTPGAVFTVAVWILLGFGFSFYVTHFGNFNKTYGALGAAIVLLLFFYINAVVLLIGAEINSVIDFETLNVKPGATDLTQAKAKAQYETEHAGEPHAKPEGAKGGEEHAPPPIHLPIVPPTPATHRTRNLLLFTSSFLALRFAWRQFWAMRAKRRAKELAKARLRPWWWPWPAT